MKIFLKILYSNLLIGSILFTVVMTINCNNDVEVTSDITAYKWKLTSIKTSNELLEPKNKIYLKDNAYILTFDSDTTFVLSTSVNDAGGKYTFSKQGEIKINSFQEFTKVGTIDTEAKKIDEYLLFIFKSAISYVVIGKILIFSCSEGKIEFTKQ